MQQDLDRVHMKALEAAILKPVILSNGAVVATVLTCFLVKEACIYAVAGAWRHRE